MNDQRKWKNWKEIPFVSISLVAINVIVFLINEFSPMDLFSAGELSVEGVLVRGEYERFLYSLFLHDGIDHIFNNMVILFFMGTMVEKEIGHFSFGAIYFISGFGGSLLSLYVKLIQGISIGSVGASGAIFGLEGLLLSMVLFYRKAMPNVTPIRVTLMIALGLYSGMMADNVDNAAHFGGILVGLIMGALLCMAKRFTKGGPKRRLRLNEEDDED
ncbi:MAG: rhomboid family intramembrane serine protease [Lachnospiraceae bacterium]|nr:rhomboid family intramembrane serine protease [Lachnospiraceae bacterium]MBQ3906495.1 rhomboid family intramembrane serine protease [Lachnospiraceae bacterium]MCR4598028.1 rhomboid family intramembrane serine protease [Acetatifactor sp.]